MGESSSSAPPRPLELWLALDGHVSSSDGLKLLWEDLGGCFDRVIIIDSDSSFWAEHFERLIGSSSVGNPTYVFQGSSQGTSSYDHIVLLSSHKDSSQELPPVGVSLAVDSPKAQSAAMAFVGSADWLHVKSASQLMITAENLISVCENTPTRVAVSVERAQDVSGLAFALEKGCDALVVSAHNLVVCADTAAQSVELLLESLQIAKAQRLEQIVKNVEHEEKSATPNPTTDSPSTKIELRFSSITNVEPGGVADRVALDFTRLLGDDEGCLVGSSAKALVFVHGETVASGFVPPRPFRVNAGPVHSYVLMADGVSTKYLCEVRAGDAVLLVSSSGSESRMAIVGRCKVEPRPTLRVEFESSSGGSGNDTTSAAQVFLQQAETVRLAGVEGPLAVTEAVVGAEVLTRVTTRGTHVGRTISAKVAEK